MLILAPHVVKWRGCGGKSNYNEEQSRGGSRCTDEGCRGTPPKVLPNTIQSEWSSVAVSTFSSDSKCQAGFPHTVEEERDAIRSENCRVKTK